MFSPEPIPLPNTIPSNTFERRTEDNKVVGWNSRSNRVTKYWRDNLLWCDDPSCLWCSDRVYGIDKWRDIKEIKK